MTPRQTPRHPENISAVRATCLSNQYGHPPCVIDGSPSSQILIVRHDDKGDAFRLSSSKDGRLPLPNGYRGFGRFICKQQTQLQHNRPTNRNPLPLPQSCLGRWSARSAQIQTREHFILPADAVFPAASIQYQGSSILARAVSRGMVVGNTNPIDTCRQWANSRFTQPSRESAIEPIFACTGLIQQAQHIEQR